VAELVPEEALERTGATQARAAFAHVPIATVDISPQADRIIFGTPARFGNMAAQMRNFLGQTGGLWATGALIAKGWQRIYIQRNAARRSGEYDSEFPHDLAAPRVRHCRAAVFSGGADGNRRDQRRQSTRRGDDHRRHGRTYAFGQ
jgi:hypothetical protein